MEMLELRDLHKTFNPGTVNEKVALNGVSLTMEAGDFATIVGSNGAGKSTLFNAITGGFIADEGSITLGGEDITFAPEHQRSKVIGHLFQDPLKGTAPNMTIEENLIAVRLDQPPFTKGIMMNKSGQDTYAKEMVEQFDIRPADNAAHRQLAKLIVHPDFLCSFNHQIVIRQNLRYHRRHGHVNFLGTIDFAFALNIVV